MTPVQARAYASDSQARSGTSTVNCRVPSTQQISMRSRVNKLEQVIEQIQGLTLEQRNAMLAVARGHNQDESSTNDTETMH
jgi:hypothetical protein